MTSCDNEITKTLSKIIEIFKKSDKKTKIECFLGVIIDQDFKYNVSFDYFKALHEVFTKSDAWSATKSKHHFATYTFQENVFGTYYIGKKPTYVKRKVLEELKIKSENRPYDLIIKLVEEENYTVKNNSSKPCFVILNEEWCYTYNDKWIYRFTKNSSGKNKEHACKSEPNFLICLETENEKNKKNIYVNDTIEKLVDLLGRYNHNYRPVICKLKIW